MMMNAALSVPGRLILLVLMPWLPGMLQAQRAFVENIGVQQRMPSKVYDVLEDMGGMIWLATEAGLCRLDGNVVTTYDHSHGMAPNGARCVFMDARQRIWVGHLGGGLSLIENDKARTLTPESGVITSDISSVTQDGEGDIWLATYGQGALRVDHIDENGSFTYTAFGDEAGLNNGLSHAQYLRDGTLFFVDAAGMLFKEEKEGAFVRYMPAGLPAEELVITTLEDAAGRLWVGTRYGGAYRLDLKGEVARYHLGNGMASNFVISFGEDLKGRMWIGTYDKGAARVDRNGIRVFNDRNGLHDNMIRCITSDREGNILLGTNVNGLDIFKGERFVNFTEADGLVDPQVWAVMEDEKGRIWFGTNGGITLWEPHADGQGAIRQITTQQGELNSNRIRFLERDAKGRVWIGTDNAGLFEFDTRTYRSGFNPEVRVADGRVTALEAGKDGEIWVGTLDGLIQYEPGKVPVVYHMDNGLPTGNISSLHFDQKGGLWVGTVFHGVARLEHGTATMLDLGMRFTPTCFTMDAEDRLWIGTEGQGVLVVKDGALAQHSTMDDGLLSNSIRALNIDRNGSIWIGSTRGLNKWMPDREGFIAYTERAGYAGIETKANATCATRAGHLWFGTAGGATRVSTDASLDEVPPPLIAMRGLRVNLEDRGFFHGMSFAHDDNNIRISYGSVSLSDPAAVQYAFMLEGVDQEWQPSTDRTEAHYPALQPGSYVFKVKAMNRSGIWSDPPAEFNFTILPPWYRSWWFYGLLVVAVGAAMFSYIKVRERQLRIRNLALERKVAERTAEVVAQSQEIEGQKVRIEGLLLNILPREVSEELKVNGKATARRHNDVTVMFTDMKGFTKVAEQMTPEELVHELDECFIKFDGITARYGIEKIKTIGDSYMCACGVPSGDQDHAIKCVLAALEVRDLMEQWRREREARGQEPWILRIGIHSGPVVAGVVGKRKFAYDIWGDTVNTASRMESSGKPGEVNISGTTYELIKEFFECEHRGRIEAKNKGSIDMYFVRRLKPAFSTDENGNTPSSELLTRLGVTQAQEEFA